jgi:hypothetical protein
LQKRAKLEEELKEVERKIVVLQSEIQKTEGYDDENQLSKEDRVEYEKVKESQNETQKQL